jgi:hypothetical protein
MSEQLIGTSYRALPDGRIVLTVSTAAKGTLFTVTLPRSEAEDNCRALARVLGLTVLSP